MPRVNGTRVGELEGCGTIFVERRDVDARVVWHFGPRVREAPPPTPGPRQGAAARRRSGGGSLRREPRARRRQGRMTDAGTRRREWIDEKWTRFEWWRGRMRHAWSSSRSCSLPHRAPRTPTIPHVDATHGGRDAMKHHAACHGCRSRRPRWFTYPLRGRPDG